MKKLYIILIVIGSIVVIAVPSIFIGVYFYSQNRIENTDVTIDTFVINDLTDGSLAGTVNFTISEPTQVDATFIIVTLNVSYNDQLLGNGTVLTESFSTQQANHTADFNLVITDQVAFTGFVEDFTNETLLTVDIDVVIEFTGALAVLGQKTVSKSLEMDGLGALDFSLQSFDLVDVKDDELHLEIVAEVYNPSAIEVEISSLNSDINDFNMTYIGNITKNNFNVQTGINILQLDVWLDGPKSALSNIISNYISSFNNTFWINYTITIEELDDLEITKDLFTVEFEGAQTDLISVEVEMISLDISELPTVSYQVDTIVTITNPISFNINLTAFEGNLTYNDEDGAYLFIPLVGKWNYTAETMIPITPLDLNWSAAPIELDPLGFKEETVSFSDSNIEQAIRFNDEYFIKNQLYVDIINGHLYIQIGDFEIDLIISIYDIYVPNS
ncbi:MAG: DUF3712 domain-containing protein [Candidatus Heimdallarchaeota archaeon]